MERRTERLGSRDEWTNRNWRGGPKGKDYVSAEEYCTVCTRESCDIGEGRSVTWRVGGSRAGLGFWEESAGEAGPRGSAGQPVAWSTPPPASLPAAQGQRLLSLFTSAPQTKCGLCRRPGLSSFHISLSCRTEAHVPSGHTAVLSLPTRAPILSLRPFPPGKANTTVPPTPRVYSSLFSFCLGDRVGVNKDPSLHFPKPQRRT